MNITDKLAKLCTNLGENNKATYAAVTIAAVKGIFRPLFTMMDKDEKPETKKYTALREGATEIVAIPVYLACGAAMSKLAEKCIPQDTSKFVFNHLKNVPRDELVAKASSNLRFVGVCVAAVFLIPALCSVVIKPFMKSIMGDNQKPAPSLVTAKREFTGIPAPKLNTYLNTRPNYGMKVGGV